MAGPRSKVVLHVPERYHGLMASGRKPLIYSSIVEMMAARGGEVAFRRVPKQRNLGQPKPDGDLHILNEGNTCAEGYLNAATAYLAGYWHLDPVGVQAESSIGQLEFHPELVDPQRAEAHLAALRERFVVPRNSRYRQTSTVTNLPEGAIAVFLQGRAPYRRGQAYLTAEEMLEAVAEAAAGRVVLVKPHPLQVEDGRALVGSLAARGLALTLTDANVHDILAAAAVTVSVNSAVAIEGLMHGTPAVLVGRSDFAAVVETATTMAEVSGALRRAMSRSPDYARFLYWYFDGHCLPMHADDIWARLERVFAKAGFPAERLGLLPLPV